jgi:hypothetical protein
MTWKPFHFLIVAISGWMNQEQQQVIDYAKLVEMVQAHGLWVRELIHQKTAGIEAAAAEELDDAGEEPDGLQFQAMECQPFEHYDYVMLMFRNDQDFQRACELLEIKRAQIAYPGGLRKVGISRCVDGGKGD